MGRPEVTDPETITQDELAGALRERTRRCGGTYLVVSDMPEAAAEIFEMALSLRKPEYEPGQIYEDIVGARYLCWYGRPLLQWVRIFPDGAVQECHHDAPVRPLRKLVPLPDHAAVLAEIVAWDGGRYADLADRICKLLEASDGH
jgi:hypothetical protein